MKSTTRIRQRSPGICNMTILSLSSILLRLSFLPAVSIIAFVVPRETKRSFSGQHLAQQHFTTRNGRIASRQPLYQTPPEKKYNQKLSDSINNNSSSMNNGIGSNNNNNEPKPAHPNDPRAYRRNRRILRELDESNNYKRAKQRVQKRKHDEQLAAAAFDLPEQPLVRTIGGGTAMIFAMAQRMFEQQQQGMTATGGTTTEDNSFTPSSSSSSSLFPRWRPASGIADRNPSFRTSSPNMNNQGYAGVIWRNVRKRDKPSLYKYALRTYDRMTETSIPSNRSKSGSNTNDPVTALGTGAANNMNYQNVAVGSDLVVQPINIHHEGALLATAKLGLWERALDIYQRVQDEEATLRRRHGMSNEMSSRQPFSVYVSERMVHSVVRACVRGSRDMKKAPVHERRRPLDQARAVLEELSDRHDIPLDSHHVNPLAAAYQAIGLRHEAAQVLELFLDERVIGPEPETGDEILNINNLGTKDKASYALLVQGAVRAEDWGAAVDNLTSMTEAGLYPVDRHLNAWKEASRTKRRTTRSWKKKRDQSWVVRTVQN